MRKGKEKVKIEHIIKARTNKQKGKEKQKGEKGTE
jgi:hypothetical protein